jgi:hypothetical protein
MASEQSPVQKRSVRSAVHRSNLLSDKEALNAWLPMFPREVFHPNVPAEFRKYFFAFAQHFPSWEAGLSAPCVI